MCGEDIIRGSMWTLTSTQEMFQKCYVKQTVEEAIGMCGLDQGVAIWIFFLNSINISDFKTIRALLDDASRLMFSTSRGKSLCPEIAVVLLGFVCIINHYFYSS